MFTRKKHIQNVILLTCHARMKHNTVLTNIKVLYGQSLSKHISKFSHKDDALKFEFDAWVSKPEFNAKKKTFILFINSTTSRNFLVSKVF
jgi:DNA mismatch repair ATPase MutL